MKRLAALAATTAFSAVALASSASAALRVVAATNDLGAIARAVGGDLVQIDVVARPDRDPHAVEVRPSTLRKTAGADVYVEVGLALDLWSAEIVRGSRNRNLIVVRCSDAIEPLEVPEGKVDAAMGDVHPEGNPHYWLDPLGGILVARHLAQQFGARDPEHAEDYRAGADAFARQVQARMEGWDRRLRGRLVVEYHRTWVYLAERFGLEIAGRVEPVPGIPPSARHLAQLSETIRSRGVPVVVRDLYQPGGPVEFLQRETGVRAEILPSSCSDPTPASYLALFDRVADVLGAPAKEPK